MVGLGNFARLTVFFGMYVLHSGRTESDTNGEHDEIDALPIPHEKLNEPFEVFEKLGRSFEEDYFDETDDDMDSQSHVRRHFPRELVENKGQCDLIRLSTMDRKCNCHLPRKRCVRISDLNGVVLSTLPRCVIIDRCEGICPDSTKCAPTESETVDVQVMAMTLVSGRSGSKSANYKYECTTVQMVKHVKCKCACELSAKDCKPNQVFRPNLCQCQCPNANEAQQCTGENKRWNPFTCECECPSIISQECSSGAFFHRTQCKCVAAEAEKSWRRKRIYRGNR